MTKRHNQKATAGKAPYRAGNRIGITLGRHQQATITHGYRHRLKCNDIPSLLFSFVCNIRY